MNFEDDDEYNSESDSNDDNDSKNNASRNRDEKSEQREQNDQNERNDDENRSEYQTSEDKNLDALDFEEMKSRRKNQKKKADNNSVLKKRNAPGSQMSHKEKKRSSLNDSVFDSNMTDQFSVNNSDLLKSLNRILDADEKKSEAKNDDEIDLLIEKLQKLKKKNKKDTKKLRVKQNSVEIKRKKRLISKKSSVKNKRRKKKIEPSKIKAGINKFVFGKGFPSQREFVKPSDKLKNIAINKKNKKKELHKRNKKQQKKSQNSGKTESVKSLKMSSSDSRWKILLEEMTTGKRLYEKSNLTNAKDKKKISDFNNLFNKKNTKTKPTNNSLLENKNQSVFVREISPENAQNLRSASKIESKELDSDMFSLYKYILNDKDMKKLRKKKKSHVHEKQKQLKKDTGLKILKSQDLQQEKNDLKKKSMRLFENSIQKKTLNTVRKNKFVEKRNKSVASMKSDENNKDETRKARSNFDKIIDSDREVSETGILKQYFSVNH